MSEDNLNDLVRRLTKNKPRSILAIGPQTDAIFNIYLSDHPECRLDTLTAAEVGSPLDGLGTYDLVYVAGVLEHLDKTPGGNLIAKIRDLHARRFVVTVPNSCQWRDTDLMAYGLHRCGDRRDDDRRVRTYEYDIATYKTTPDWLNGRNWAHPELFDKFRW